MNALEIAQAEADEAERLREERQAARDAAELEEKRREPIVAAFSQIMPHIPDPRCVEYHLFPWEKWARQSADRIVEFVKAVEAAGYSDRLDFMAELTDFGPDCARSWRYVLIAKQAGTEALHTLILKSLPRYAEPIEPCWWPAFKQDFPSGQFFSELTVEDLLCPACGEPRTAQAAKDDRRCDDCRSLVGTMAQAVEAWDMRILYREEIPSFRIREVKRLILAAAQVVRTERKKRPELHLLEKTNGRRAIWLLTERLKISMNDAYELPIAKAMAEFENWNSPPALPVVKATETPKGEFLPQSVAPIQNDVSPASDTEALSATEDTKLSSLERQILLELAISEPQTQEQLAKNASGKDQANGNFKAACSRLVSLGYIVSGGKGRSSSGYKLDQKGLKYITSRNGPKK